MDSGRQRLMPNPVPLQLGVGVSRNPASESGRVALIDVLDNGVDLGLLDS